MATDTQIKVRTAIALDRLMQTAGRLAERLPAVQAPEIPTRHRYPEMLPTLQVEAMADFIDALDTELGGGPDLGEMTRGELNEYAAHVGVVDPTSYDTKGELAAAIEGAGNAGAQSPADEALETSEDVITREEMAARQTKKGKAS